VIVIGAPPASGYAVIVYDVAPAEVDHVTVSADAVILVGGSRPVVSVVAVDDVVPLVFVDDTTMLKVVFPGSGGVNLAGGDVVVVVNGGPPPAGYAVTI